MENKICQNCKAQFSVEPEDFTFYQKIQVPPPTFCPECRLIRRLAWRNESSLHKRSCDLCGKSILSVFSKKAGLKLYCNPCWWSDKWDASSYARDYDFSKPFFEQLLDLMKEVPFLSLFAFETSMINSNYCNMVNDLKNCYLIHNSTFNENCYYGSAIVDTKDSVDNNLLKQCELSYSSVNCVKCYRALFSQDLESCNDVWFSKNLINCSNCFGCVNLRNKQHHIFNETYSKEEYFKKLEEFNLGSYKVVSNLKKQGHDFWIKFPNKYIHGRHNQNVSGDYIYYSKNCLECFDVANMVDSKFCSLITSRSIKDCYDFTHWGDNSELIYEGLQIGGGISGTKFSWGNWTESQNNNYCIFVVSSSNLFASIGLRHKQYCILNKQYTKEEYEKLAPKIIEHMNFMPYTDKKGRVYKYGEFFPSEISPFAYNETTAQEYFPLTKEQAIKQGHSWKDPETKDYQIQIPNDKLSDNIKDVQDNIVGQVIECQHQGKCNEQCTTAFKIIPQELQFYKRMNLPLPRLCPNCRHYQRIKQRNPLKLWYRKCQCAGGESDNKIYTNTVTHNHHKKDHCPNEFQTTYAPERKEIVYCEKCYQEEVV